jgi:osmotically-inducible protein OsmY
MTDEALALSVQDELFWDPKVDLNGSVRSWSEHDAALAAAWAAPGVTTVDDRLTVSY